MIAGTFLSLFDRCTGERSRLNAAEMLKNPLSFTYVISGATTLRGWQKRRHAVSYVASHPKNQQLLVVAKLVTARAEGAVNNSSLRGSEIVATPTIQLSRLGFLSGPSRLLCRYDIGPSLCAHLPARRSSERLSRPR